MIDVKPGGYNLLSSMLRASNPATHDASRNGKDEADSTSSNDDPHQGQATADFSFPFLFPSLLLPALLGEVCAFGPRTFNEWQRSMTVNPTVLCRMPV